MLGEAWEQQRGHEEDKARNLLRRPYYRVPRTPVFDDASDAVEDDSNDDGGFDLVYSMHTAFTDTLKARGAGDANAMPLQRIAPRDHPLFVSMMKLAAECKVTQPQGATRQCLPLVYREYEERFMRPAAADEPACMHGQQCEGHHIARHVYARPEWGFTLPAFVLPSGGRCNNLCVLCLRKETATHFYALRTQQDGDLRPSSVVQPYRNVIDVPGEYRGDACLYPSRKRFEGISDPYVQHLRHRYEYVETAEGQHIVHGPTMLYFRQPPPLRGASPAQRYKD